MFYNSLSWRSERNDKKRKRWVSSLMLSCSSFIRCVGVGVPSNFFTQLYIFIICPIKLSSLLVPFPHHHQHCLDTFSRCGSKAVHCIFFYILVWFGRQNIKLAWSSLFPFIFAMSCHHPPSSSKSSSIQLSIHHKYCILDLMDWCSLWEFCALLLLLFWVSEAHLLVWERKAEIICSLE